MTLGSYSRSCRTAFIRSGIAGGLAGELARAVYEFEQSNDLLPRYLLRPHSERPGNVRATNECN